jgi:Tfp pilus assembly protein FimT
MQPNDRVAAAFIVLFFTTTLMCVVLALQLNSTLQLTRHEAIERGYASYCPSDGRLEWAGECNDE